MPQDKTKASVKGFKQMVRDFPAQEQGKVKSKPRLNRENTAVKEAELLSKLPTEGLESPDGSAISAAYFPGVEGLKTTRDVYEYLDPDVRDIVRRLADQLSIK